MHGDLEPYDQQGHLAMDEIESFIDDSCPTIWGPTSSRPRDALYEAVPQQRAQFRHDSIPRTLPAIPHSMASAKDGRIKPIEGALLRKLFQATMEEKRKAEEKRRAAQQPLREHAEELTKALNDVAVSKGFYVPNIERRNVIGADEERVQKAEPLPDVLGKDKKVGKKGKNKAKAATAAAVEDETLPGSAHEAAESDNGGSVPPAAQESKGEKSKAQKEPMSDPKPHEHEGKLSKKEKKKLKQAQKERAKDGEALMSGGLAAGLSKTGGKQDGVGQPDECIELLGDGRGPIEQKVVTPRSLLKSGTIHLQPTVESVASSRPSKHKQTSPKPRSAKSDPHNNVFQLATSVEKPKSFVSWDEVGHGVVGQEIVRVASRIASSKHSSNATSKHEFEGFDQVWEVPEVELVASEQPASRHESKVSSRRSSKRREEETHSRSHVSQARHSRSSQPLKMGTGHEHSCNNPWQQEEQVRSSSKSSANKTRAALANETDAWAEDDVPLEMSKHGSSRHSRRAASQRTFEEVGVGWAQAPPEAPRSRISAYSAHSIPLSFNEERLTTQMRPHSVSEKVAASKITTHRSAARTFEEIGDGWQGQNGVEIVARSRRSSMHSRKVSSRGWKANAQDDEASNVPIFEHRPEESSQRWVEVDEPGYAESTKQSHKSHDSYTHLEATRPTVFAGKGWISPHPLSRSPTEMASPPQSKIVLPSEAFPHGATMTYDEWKEVQEEGLRRNISPTESHMTINARRAQSRHRFAGWGAHSSDGHRFEEVAPEAESSASGPASYRVPSMDSERSSGGLISDERPPTEYIGQEHDFEPSWVGEWEERHPAQSSEQSGRHSRVQTLSQWSHEHSGSKQAHDGSEVAGSGWSGDSSKPSSRHDSSRSAHQSSRQSSRHSKSHRASRISSERRPESSERRSDSPQSKSGSIGWGRFSLGTARSRQSHQSDGRESRRSSHHTSHHTSQHSPPARSKSGSNDWQGSRLSSEEGSQKIRHSSVRDSHHSGEQSVSTRSRDRSTAWREASANSQHLRHESDHPASRHSSHHSRSVRTRADIASA